MEKILTENEIHELQELGLTYYAAWDKTLRHSIPLGNVFYDIIKNTERIILEKVHNPSFQVDKQA